ncbi:hypothetical protein ACW68H_05660 [Vibrio diabolicus]
MFRLLQFLLLVLPSITFANEDVRLSNSECAFSAYIMLEITGEENFSKAGDYFLSQSFKGSNKQKYKKKILEAIAINKDGISAQKDLLTAQFHLAPKAGFNGKTCAEQFLTR